MKINERIKTRRKELGLSADTIAEQLHISRASYYRYESEEVYNLPINIIKPLSQILHIPPAFLMGWEDANGKDLVGDGNTIMELYNQLDPDDQAEVIDIMKLKLSRKKDVLHVEKLSV